MSTQSPMDITAQDNASESAPLAHHPKFPATSDTDITIQSSDGVLFHLHRKNLEYTGAFPGAEWVAPPEEITHLTEPSNVLAVVFDFIYPRKHPQLENMDYIIVGPVAEAVEKYEVFSAMHACDVRLRQLAPDYPAQIMVHGIKHGYPKLVDEATPYFSRKTLVEIAQVLPPDYFLPWCRYREAWDNVFKKAMQHIAKSYRDSNDLGQILDWQAIDNLSVLRDTLQDDSVHHQCPNCGYHVNSKFSDDNSRLLAKICREEIDRIPAFTSFL